MRVASRVGSDQTIDTWSPGKGRRASTGPPWNHWKAVFACGLLAAEVGDHRALPIVGLGDLDAGGAAHEGICAVGPDEQSRGDSSAILQLQENRFIVEPRFLDLRRREDRDIEPGPQRVLQRAVLDDPRELRHARAVGVELEPRRAVVAEDAHGVHGRDASRRQRLPGLQPAQESHVSRAQGVDAGVEGGRRRRRAFAALVRDERHRRSAQSARQACSDRASAHDDELEVRWFIIRGLNRHLAN